MRTIVLTLLLAIAIPGIAVSQKVKKITETSKEKFNPSKQVYEVLADSPTIRHGIYEYYRGKNIYISGFYNRGLKDSVWKTFWPGSTPTSQKMYRNGQKTGVWEWWDFEGNRTFSFDFSKNEGKKYVTDKFPDTTTFYYEMPDGSWKVDASVTPPVKLFTPASWQQFLNFNLRYPQEAIDSEMQGTVKIAVQVDENGDAIDYQIAKTAGAPLDKEALRVIKLFQPEFVPAEKNGKKIKFWYIQPLVFRLEAD